MLSAYEKSIGANWISIKNQSLIREAIRVCFEFNHNLPRKSAMNLLRTVDGQIILVSIKDYPHAIRIEDQGTHWLVCHADIQGRKHKVKKALFLEMSDEDIEELRQKYQLHQSP